MSNFDNVPHYTVFVTFKTKEQREKRSADAGEAKRQTMSSSRAQNKCRAD